MKPDGTRMTDVEYDEVFAEQEEQSDDSAPPTQSNYNSQRLAPSMGNPLLVHSGPIEKDRNRDRQA